MRRVGVLLVALLSAFVWLPSARAQGISNVYWQILAKDREAMFMVSDLGSFEIAERVEGSYTIELLDSGQVPFARLVVSGVFDVDSTRHGGVLKGDCVKKLAGSHGKITKSDLVATKRQVRRAKVTTKEVDEGDYWFTKFTAREQVAAKRPGFALVLFSNPSNSQYVGIQPVPVSSAGRGTASIDGYWSSFLEPHGYAVRGARTVPAPVVDSLSIECLPPA